ncbi:MAG: bifunctional [glutamate--ammonia ligase]-adenylyl-L-tyrosine phosphorylase/[glutamate--ammonia-ligase] adenylyltransferase [Gammaproteobacteria bacterium]|nr:bifunctional [glutamate--ammonia ligase]-adenylyl-L-tyrosine phosphorylase/[glutamate--ammonia-ligase] adenylyltransferase [Gammaproteobacteria bacterium]
MSPPVKIPQDLVDLVDDHRASLTAETLQFLESAGTELYAEWMRVIAISDYVADSTSQNTSLLRGLIESCDLHTTYADDVYQTRLQATLTNKDRDLGSLLREFRRREMIRIIWRDLNNLANLLETTRDLSNLADACVFISLDILYRQHCQKYGTPMGNSTNAPQNMVVLALGKLGARELNLSSDIDLIFFYAEQGHTKSADESSEVRGSLTNQEFFTRLSRTLIKVLDEIRADGFVFRVDMRLRPYGESGVLIMSRNALEKYYVEQGRDWERYAFIKARVIAGDLEAGDSILNWLRPFIYRKHLDYGAIESLRSMKALINVEVRKRDLAEDIKLGPGGIREIEFIAQCHQLIWGGHDQRLRETRLLNVLQVLKIRGDMPSEQVDQLVAAYEFLRNTEHLIQAESDSQTQRLPASEKSRRRLSFGMGFDSWQDYSEQLEAHRNAVILCFSTLIRTTDEEMDALVEGELVWSNVWRHISEDERSAETLAHYGFNDAKRAVRLLQHLGSLTEKESAQEITVERFNRLMPSLLGLIAKESESDEALNRIVAILEAIFRRSTYIAFLLENHDALTRMVNCCAASRWIAEQLRQQPVLLYELTDQNSHAAVPDKEALVLSLSEFMANTDAADLGEQMDALRRFKNGHQLRVAVLELSNLLPVMKVSDYLTWLAEAVLDKVLQIAWRYLQDKHGNPVREDGSECDPDFAIIGYGKLGGLELGYGSDLDLVFIYDCARQGMTTGVKSIDNTTFYIRLAQRISHILGSVTGAGVLYEIDMRLRPSGRQGPLAASLRAFDKYQLDDAWTWEHQALVRARYVAGDRKIGDKFAIVREKILGQVREQSVLIGQITEMRQKMRLARPSIAKESIGFDIKHEKGAIVDIEFMIQYAVLAWSSRFPQLCVFSDNYRVLGILGDCGLVTQEEVTSIQNAYLNFRAAAHFQALGGQLDASAFQKLEHSRQQVNSLWDKLLSVTT